MSVIIPTKTLPSGAEIPVIGLGVYKAEPGDGAYNAVLSALKLGYRHIDTAQFYQNEADVGRAIRDSGIPRKEIFVTNTPTSLRIPCCCKSSRARQVSSLVAAGPGVCSRYKSMHLSPSFSLLAMAAGTAFSYPLLSVNNLHLEKFMETAKVKPTVNQLELHPWLMRSSLVEYCREHDILLQL